jgi:hypothetical protein
MNKYVDHVTINGETYYTGTVFLTSGMYLSYPHNWEETFVAYDPKSDYVHYILHRFTGEINGSCPREMFAKNIISVLDKKNERVKCPEKKKRPEMQIDGMFDGWLLYIVAMAVSTIFKGNIWYWVLWTFIFCNWRAKKIEKEGYYYEWET